MNCKATRKVKAVLPSLFHPRSPHPRWGDLPSSTRGELVRVLAELLREAAQNAVAAARAEVHNDE